MVYPAFSPEIRLWPGLIVIWTAAALAAPPATEQLPAVAAPARTKAAKPEALTLRTTDGVDLRAWYYPATFAEDAGPLATVILLHDLDGSHRSVEPLALALQAAGCDVVAPDLRGHGASTDRAGDTIDVRHLKKPDFELMAAGRIGRIREQAAIRGDVEAVRNWIKSPSGPGATDRRPLDIDRLFVVGSGLGAAVAAAWTAEDANWPERTSGPQGRQVRGLVLISPTWTTRGFSINAALGHETLKQGTPVLVLGGRDDQDAAKVFDYLKRHRPADWFVQQADGSKEQSPKLQDPTKASLFRFDFDSSLSADDLAADRTLDPAAVIGRFFSMALDRPKR